VSWIDDIQRSYLDAAAGHRLVLPRCGECDRWHWYPKFRCPHCAAPGWQWADAGTSAAIFTFTTVSHPFKPSSRVPFVVGVVEPDAAPGVRLVTRIVDTSPDAVEIGQRVQVDFRPVDPGGPVLPVFRPAG
jgi:uncharacterized OB-fold protein